MKFRIGDKVYYHNQASIVTEIDADDGDVKVLILADDRDCYVKPELLSFIPRNTPLWVGGWAGNASMVVHAVSEVRELAVLTLNPDDPMATATATTLMVYRNADGVEMARPLDDFHACYRLSAAEHERDCLDTIEMVEGGYRANLRVGNDKNNVRVFAPTLGRLRELVQRVLR